MFYKKEKNNFFVLFIRGLVLVYCSLLTFLLIVPNRGSVITYLQNKFQVGFPIPEKNYADVCEIYVSDSPNPFANVTDRIDMFVLAHSIGWFIKAMIVRDNWVSWTCSLLFELVELSFAHLLPNFNECWWDSVLLDVLGCNLIGIHLASYVRRKLNMKSFDFLKRTTNFRAVFSAFLLVLLITLIDLNYFFLKFIFAIPNTHWLCVLRTLLWIGISVPSALELFQWSKNSTKSTASAVIGSTGLLLEMAVCYKFSDNLFQNSPPMPILAIVMIVSLIYAISWAWIKTTRSSLHHRGSIKS